MQPIDDEREPRGDRRRLRRSAVAIGVLIVVAIAAIIALHVTGTVEPPAHGG